MSSPLKIFCCCARKDQDMQKLLLETHLKPLQQSDQIKVWSSAKLYAGVEWKKEIHQQLESADIILLLISPDFMGSDYCHIEMMQAIERHDQDNTLVIPILLRPVHWENEPFAKLQIIPTNAKPVTCWRNDDEAFHDVVGHIKRVLPERRNARMTGKDATLYKDEGKQQHTQQQAADLQAALERELAHETQQEGLLREFFDWMINWQQMEEIDTNLPQRVYPIARLRTRTVLRQLDAKYKGDLLQFVQADGILNNLELNDIDWSGVDLRGADFRNADLHGFQLRDAQLQGARLDDANLQGADLRKADLTKADLTNAKLSEADLTESIFCYANANGADFVQAIVRKVDFSDAKLSSTFFIQADLTEAKLCRADLRQATFNGTIVNENNNYPAILKGANLQGALLEETYLDRVDLTKAQLESTDYSRAYLNRAALPDPANELPPIETGE